MLRVLARPFCEQPRPRPARPHINLIQAVAATVSSPVAVDDNVVDIEVLAEGIFSVQSKNGEVVKNANLLVL